MVLSFSTRRTWSTVLKAFERSKKTAPVKAPLSRLYSKLHSSCNSSVFRARVMEKEQHTAHCSTLQNSLMASNEEENE